MNFSDGFNQGMYDGDIDINITNSIPSTKFFNHSNFGDLFNPWIVLDIILT